MFKAVKKLLFCIGSVILFAECQIGNDFDEQERDEIVNKLTDAEWVIEFPITSPENGTGRESWRLNRDGSGTTTRFISYESGRKEAETLYFTWLFWSADFRVIYMNLPRYWVIRELQWDKLCVQESLMDPERLGSGDWKEYKEFITAKEQEK